MAFTLLRPRVSRSIAAPSDVVWRLLVDIDVWSEWGPSITGAALTSERFELGARGTVRTAVGLSLPFEVTRYEPGLSWAWSVAGVPATTHDVRPTDGGCEVTFGVPWWAPGYLPVCAVALRRIERLALTR